MDKISDCSNAEMEYNNNIARLRLELQLNDLIKNKELLEAHKLSLSARNSDASILLSDKNRLLATVNSNIQQRYTKLEDVNDKINTITQDIYTNNMEMKRKENIIQTLKIIIIIVVIMVVILMVYFGMEYVDKTNPGVFQDFFNKFNNTIYV
jgi:ABC-type Na+ efflux pump permease subunit